MLTQIVLIQQGLLHSRQLRRQLAAAENPHIGDLFQHDGVMHRVFGVLAQANGPWEWTSTPGICAGSIPCWRKVSTITLPVSHS